MMVEVILFGVMTFIVFKSNLSSALAVTVAWGFSGFAFLFTLLGMSGGLFYLSIMLLFGMIVMTLIYNSLE